MAHPGQIVLFPFPETNLSYGKLRPALIIESAIGFENRL